MAYATAAQMYSRYDCRILADLVKDDDTRLGDNTSVALIQVALNTNTVISDLLSDASGIVNSATLAGQRYTVAQLTALTGDDANVLVRLVVDLAFGLLVHRRGQEQSHDMTQFKKADEDLEKLRNGQHVFNVAAELSAGIPSSYFPTTAQYSTLNLFRDYASPRFFPSRRTQNNG